MTRMTVKDLKEKLQRIPDDAIVCCQSDSEGNETSTVLDMFVEKVGLKVDYQGYKFTQGDGIIGVDLDKDKNRYIVIFQPSL